MDLRIFLSFLLVSLLACGDLSQEEASSSAATGQYPEGLSCESGKSSRSYNLKFLGCVDGKASYEVLDHDTDKNLDLDNF